MLSYKITDISAIKGLSFNKIEFYYNGCKLPEELNKEAVGDLIRAFGMKDSHSMLKEALSHNVKSMFSKELSKEDRSLILRLVSDINDDKNKLGE